MGVPDLINMKLRRPERNALIERCLSALAAGAIFIFCLRRSMPVQNPPAVYPRPPTPLYVPYLYLSLYILFAAIETVLRPHTSLFVGGGRG